MLNTFLNASGTVLIVAFWRGSKSCHHWPMFRALLHFWHELVDFGCKHYPKDSFCVCGRQARSKSWNIRESIQKVAMSLAAFKP
jgi:hypothetical protein